MALTHRISTRGKIVPCLLLTSFLVLGIFTILPATVVRAQSTSGLTITSQSTSGAMITGYYTVLFDSSSNVLATGFTPDSFMLTSGQAYSVKVYNYGSCSFVSWADGSTANPRVISISSDTRVTAVYNCGTSSGSASKITVASQDQNGNTISGYYTLLYSSGSSVIATGFTPETFSVTVGLTYTVKVDSYSSCIFARWSNGLASDPITITATSATTSLIAVYNCGNSSGVSSVTVNSVDQKGNPISGYYTVLYDSRGNMLATGFTTKTFTQTIAGQTYGIRAESYGSCAFSSWSNGVTADPMTFTTSGGAQSFTAAYNCGSSSSGNSSAGITVTANRIPADYWAPCFALICSRGTGPGASMFFTLYDSNGRVVATGFADEHGFTFTGLEPSATYYVYPADCDNCHGSTHDVLFQYWANGSGNEINYTRPLAVTVGETVNAWYSCTNGCGGT